MNLRDYRWFNNPRGLHNLGIGQGIDMNRYTIPKLGWAKLVTAEDEYTKPRHEGGPSHIDQFMAASIMPIIRVFRSNMIGMRLENDPKQLDWYGKVYPEYIRQGALWFEFYNEPNLDGEWPDAGVGWNITWENRDIIKMMMDPWIEWAERIVNLGGYPAFPALTDSAHPKAATVYWLREMLRYLREQHERRFRHVIQNGLWCATHPYIANHFYQSPAGGAAYNARQPHEQDGAGPGWHFEYPYDPLQQRNDPGRTVFGGTTLTPYGDPNGLIATGLAFQQLLWRYFRAGPVPVVGTEGGIWRVPDPRDPPHIIDDRYPGYTYDSHAQATLAMFRWIATQAPPWFFGLTQWTEGDWYDQFGTIKAVDVLAANQPLLKDVPSIEVQSGGRF